MKQVMHIFELFKRKHKLNFYMEPSLIQIDYGGFKTKQKYFLNTI